MKKLFPLLLLTLFVFAATPDAPKMATVEGTLVDGKCFGMNTVNAGDEHVVPMKDGSMGKMAGCATACAKMGIPVGLLEGGKPGNQVYILVTPSGQLADHMAKEARVTGMVAFDGGLIPQKIEVKEGRKWKEVKIATMM